VVALPKTKQGITLFAHMQVVENLKTETLQEFVNQHLTEGTSFGVTAAPVTMA